MSTESVLPDHMLQELRSRGVIRQQEVAISIGDLYYAKNVLTNEKRIIENNIVSVLNKNESLKENNAKTLLKG